jgi:AcrR family transcriptional regulator
MARKPPGKAAGQSGKTSDPVDRIVDAAMNLAGERGWRGLGLVDIAGAAGMTLSELYRHVRGKGAILDAFRRRIDAAVLAASGPADPEESARDRLFDVLMRRFDALKPHRDAVAVLWRESTTAPFGDPLAALSGLCGLARSMAWMLEAAGISTSGLLGRLRVKGLGAVWLATLPVWLKDESEDSAATMAALDRNLKRAEEACNSLPRWPFGRPRAAGTTA